MLPILASTPTVASAAPNCTPENINPATRPLCITEPELHAYCAFETLYEQHDPGIASIQLRITTGSQNGDDSDGRFWVRLGEERTFLDHPKDDFRKGAVETFELLGTGVRRLSDLTQLEIGNDASDTLGVEKVSLSINGRDVFETPDGFRQIISNSAFGFTRDEMSLDIKGPTLPRAPSRSPIARQIETFLGHHIRTTGLAAEEIDADHLGQIPALDVIEEHLGEVGIFDGVDVGALVDVAEYLFEDEDLDVRVNWMTDFGPDDEHQTFEFYLDPEDPTRARFLARIEILIRDGDQDPVARQAVKVHGSLRTSCFDGRLLLIGDEPVWVEFVQPHQGDDELAVFEGISTTLANSLQNGLSDLFGDTRAMSPTGRIAELVIASGIDVDAQEQMLTTICPEPTFHNISAIVGARDNDAELLLNWEYFASLNIDDRIATGEVPAEEEVCEDVWLGGFPLPGGDDGGTVLPDGVGDYIFKPNLIVDSIVVRADDTVDVTIRNASWIGSNQTYVDVFFGLAQPPQMGEWGSEYRRLDALDGNASQTINVPLGEGQWIDVIVDTDDAVDEASEDDNRGELNTEA